MLNLSSIFIISTISSTIEADHFLKYLFIEFSLFFFFLYQAVNDDTTETPPQTRSRTALRHTLPNNTDSRTATEVTTFLTEPSIETYTARPIEDQLLEAQERYSLQQNYKRNSFGILLRQKSHVTRSIKPKCRYE